MITSPILRPKAVLFDWDNTLADTWPTIHEALTATFTAMGHVPWTMDEVKERVHRSLRDSFPKVFGADWEKAREIYLNHFLQINLTKLASLPGAEDVLKQLKQADIYMAVVSNKTGKHLRSEIMHMGWDHYFAKAVGATDTIEDKPSPLPPLHALEGSSIMPGPDVWLIGDTITDLECALNANIRPLFFGNHPMPSLTHLNGVPKPNSIPHFRTHTELSAFVSRVV